MVRGWRSANTKVCWPKLAKPPPKRLRQDHLRSASQGPDELAFYWSRAMLLNFATVVLVCSIAIWVALFEADFSPQPILFSLVFCLESSIGPYCLYLKHKKPGTTSFAAFAIGTWLFVGLGLTFLWNNDPGDWNLKAFVIFHSMFSTPVIAAAYAVRCGTKWIRDAKPKVARACKIILLSLSVLIVAGVSGSWYAEIQASRPSATRVAAHHHIALRFGDTIIFGTTSGLWGWTISESTVLRRILPNISDATGAADLANGRLLLVNSSEGVSCTQWGVEEAVRVVSLPLVRALFRAGWDAWALSALGDLYNVRSSNGKCDNLEITKVDLGGNKLAGAEISRRNLLVVACKDLATLPSKADCNIHRLGLYPPSPPKKIGQIGGLIGIVSFDRGIWIASADELLEFRDVEPDRLGAIEHVGRHISRMLLLEDGPWVESDSGSWLWSHAASSLTSVRPVSRLDSYAVIGDQRWASSREGVFRWNPRIGETPSLVSSDVGFVKRYVRWNGCVWLASPKGLHRVCDGNPDKVERVAVQARTVADLVVAGWEKDEAMDTRSDNPSAVLWATTDVGLMRFSAANPTVPSVVSAAASNADLLTAGEYLWINSDAGLSKWKLDSTTAIENVESQNGRFSQVCTDMTAAWVISSAEILRIPDVQGPDFRFNFEELRKGQFKREDGRPGERDTRYWNCKEFNPPALPRSYVSRVTLP